MLGVGKTLSKVTSQSTKALSNKKSPVCQWESNFASSQRIGEETFGFITSSIRWGYGYLLTSSRRMLYWAKHPCQRHLDVESERRRERKFTHRPDSKGSDSHFPPYRWILWPASSLRCLLLSGSASTWVLVKPVLMSGMHLPPFLASILSSFVLAGEYEPPTF